MTNWAYLTMIVPDACVGFARVASEKLAGQTGAEMLIAAASQTGGRPPTHWVTQGPFSTEFAGLLPMDDYTADPPSFKDGRADLVSMLANQAGLNVTEQQVKALFDASDISNQPLFDALNRLGLKLCEMD